MLLVLTLLAVAIAAPATYDQRQDGEFNFDANVQNVLFLVALPKKMPLSIFDILSKNHKPVDKEPELQDRSDIRVMEAFVEPSTPYRVEIGSDRAAEGDGRAVEVVIAGRRRSDLSIDNQDDEMKLLGATENCGPGRVRDSETLLCKDEMSAEPISLEKKTNEKESKVESQPAPEVIST